MIPSSGYIRCHLRAGRTAAFAAVLALTMAWAMPAFAAAPACALVGAALSD
jgi:hypothetical protein